MTEVAQREHATPVAMPALAENASFGEFEGATRVPVGGISRPLRRQSGDAMGGQAAPDSVATVLKGSGSALPSGLRRSMEGALGGDFSKVRVHSGSAAAKSADDVQAHAYTSGNNIVLGKGVDLDSQSGMHTIAHELTHVRQQQTGRDRGTGGTVGHANDPLEHEAEQSAHDVVGALRRQTKDCDCGQEHGA